MPVGRRGFIGGALGMLLGGALGVDKKAQADCWPPSRPLPPPPVIFTPQPIDLQHAFEVARPGLVVDPERTPEEAAMFGDVSIEPKAFEGLADRYSRATLYSTPSGKARMEFESGPSRFGPWRSTE